MWRRLVSPLFVALVAAIVAVTGTTSAGMMAPDRAELALESYEMVHGPLGDELCGGEQTHDHHCPFCHALPEAPAPGHDGPAFLLTASEEWRRLDDLHRAAQARNHQHLPRAPPEIA